MERLTHPVQYLARQVAEEQDRYLRRDDAELEAVRRRLLVTEATLVRGRRAKSRVWLLSVAALVSVAAVAAGVLWMRRPSPLAFQVAVSGARASGEVGAWISAPQSSPANVEFSDGSLIKLDPRTRARVIELTGSGAGVVFESGRAHVSITPRREARWRLNLGPFTVQVTGTRFDVDWDPETEVLRLSMHEGKVVVSGCMFEEGRPVVAGERLRAACREQRLEIRSGRSVEEVTGRVAPEAPSPSSDVVALEPAPSVVPPGPDSSAARADELQALLKAGRYKEAFAVASANGGFAAACERASAQSLMGLADGARFSGDLAAAEKAYSVLRRRFPRSERASVAAFNLARIAFDQRHSYSDAARWLDTYLRERPSGALAREALGRLMEAQQRAGRRDDAKQTAAGYLARYPSGPHAELARRLTTR